MGPRLPRQSTRQRDGPKTAGSDGSLRIKIAPSILAADQANLGAAVKSVEKAGADMIHVDVTDGHFAPNISMGPDTVKSLRGITSLPLDTHLMIDNPRKFLDSFLTSGSDVVTVHAETVNRSDVEEFSKIVHSKGRKLGLAVKPATPLPEWLKTITERLDLLLILSVNPGFPGQKFMPQVLPKLQDAMRLAGDRRRFEIEVDGGVDESNAGLIAQSGANILVAGASIFRRPDAGVALRNIRQLTENPQNEVPA